MWLGKAAVLLHTQHGVGGLNLMVMNIRFLYAVVLLLNLALSGCRVQKYPPELTQALPNKSPIGSEVTLIGFQFGNAATVSFGADGVFFQGKINSANDQVIKVIVPRMPTGKTQVRATNEEGATDPIPFTVLQPLPIVSSIAPTNALPGQKVVITGDFLDQLQWVRFGPGSVYIPDAIASKIAILTPQSVTVTVPDVPRGPQTLGIETTGGIVTRPFLIAGTPEITSFSPKRPRLSEEITILGKNLYDGVVRVNGLVMPVSKNTDAELRISIPANSTSGKLTVTLYDQLTATTADSVQLALAPTIDLTGLSLTEGIAGDRLLVNGRNLRDVTTAKVGNTPALFRALSDTQIEVILPVRAQTGEVFVILSNLGGSVTSYQSLLYYNAPSELVFSPARTLRGREIVMTGKSVFRITGVLINGRPAPITSRVESTEIKFTVPNDATTGPIFMVNRAGSSTTTRSLTVVLPPTVTDLTRKAIVGNRVVVSGLFLLDAGVYFTGSQGAAPNDGRNTDGELWVRVPNDAQTGPVRVTNLAGETTTTVSFTALRAPTGIAFGPDLAKINTDITITGQNLTDVTAVRFSNNRSTPAKFRVSGQNLIATVPSDALDGPICLTNEAGTVCSSGSFRVLAPASNIAFTPTSTTIGGTITLSGINIANTREVKFNNGRSTAANFRIVGQNLIVTVPPDVQPGAICLTNEGGIGCSGLDFTPQLPPANLALSVTTAAIGAEITITGANLLSTKVVRFGNGTSSATKFRGTGTTPEGLIVTVPTDATNGPICITNDGGTTCTTVSFTVK